MNLPVPGDEPPDPFLDPYLGTIAELALGAGEIRRGQRHVPGLIGPALDDRLPSDSRADQRDQPFEPYLPAPAHVENAPRLAAVFAGARGPLQRRPDSVHGIGNIRVIALGRAVAPHHDRLP